tara:strand:- start:2119 stop:2961 length:843 start_codon:yes stop_codon:yes gene_type:complete
MKKILIIGSDGYIGRSLIIALKNRYKLVLPSHKLSEIDVLKKKTLAKYIKPDIDIIINLSGQIAKKKIFEKIIVNGNKNIIDTINAVKKEILYIFMSSCLVYGYKILPATEKSKLTPANPYARLKLKAENYIKKNLSHFRILRLANVYGDDYKSGFFKKFFFSINKKKKIIFSNLLTSRNVIHLKDVIKSIVLVIKNKEIEKYNKLIINIGNENIKLSKIKDIFLSYFDNRLNLENKKKSLREDSSQVISTEKFDNLVKWRKIKINQTLLTILKKNEKYI